MSDQVFQPPLTVREKQVAELILDGLTTRQAAAQLGIAARTAANTLTRIYEKLGINGRDQLTHDHIA